MMFARKGSKVMKGERNTYVELGTSDDVSCVAGVYEVNMHEEIKDACLIR